MPARVHSTCTVTDCARPHYGSGLCHMHYQRNRRHGTTDARVRVPKHCSAPGCDRLARGRGLCHAHYVRWYSGSENTGPIQSVVGTPPEDTPTDRSRAEWVAYAAGFFDGEGCVSIITQRGRGHYLSVAVGQLDPAPIKILQSLWGGCIKLHRKPVGQRPMFTWTATCRQAASALRDLAPLLIVKRDQADLALHFQSTVTGASRRRAGRAEAIAAREDMCRRLAAMKRREYADPRVA